MIDEYKRHSPSKLNLFCAQPSMFTLEYILGVKQPVGPAAHRGVAVEDGVTYGLKYPGASADDVSHVAIVKYDSLTALSGDPRREKYREPIPDMVATALRHLRRYGAPTATQEAVEWHPVMLELPIFGYLDYRWDQHGIVADLKTTERMPSEIKIPHARQVSLYAVSDNMHAHLIYVTPKKLESYLLENIGAHRAALAGIARRVENFLDLSDDPEYFLTITAPDLESFYWNNPEARELAFRYWKL